LFPLPCVRIFPIVIVPVLDKGPSRPATKAVGAVDYQGSQCDVHKMIRFMPPCHHWTVVLTMMLTTRWWIVVEVGEEHDFIVIFLLLSKRQENIVGEEDETQLLWHRQSLAVIKYFEKYALILSPVIRIIHQLPPVHMLS
jgi:hypothetical protein